MLAFLAAILTGGGVVGAGSAWLVTGWLERRRARREAERPDWHAPIGTARHDAAAGEPVRIEMPVPTRRPAPVGRPAWIDTSASGCGYRNGDHLCHLPVGHQGEHVCTCQAIPVAHKFS